MSAWTLALAASLGGSNLMVLILAAVFVVALAGLNSTLPYDLLEPPQWFVVLHRCAAAAAFGHGMYSGVSKVRCTRRAAAVRRVRC